MMSSNLSNLDNIYMKYILIAKSLLKNIRLDENYFVRSTLSRYYGDSSKVQWRVGVGGGESLTLQNELKTTLKHLSTWVPLALHPK